MIRLICSLVMLACVAAPQPAAAEGSWRDRSQQWVQENAHRDFGEPMTRSAPRFSNRAAQGAAMDPAAARQQCRQQCANAHSQQMGLCGNGQTYKMVVFCQRNISRKIENCARRCQ